MVRTHVIVLLEARNGHGDRLNVVLKRGCAGIPGLHMSVLLEAVPLKVWRGLGGRLDIIFGRGSGGVERRHVSLLLEAVQPKRLARPRPLERPRWHGKGASECLWRRC